MESKFGFPSKHLNLVSELTFFAAPVKISKACLKRDCSCLFEMGRYLLGSTRSFKEQSGSSILPGTRKYSGRLQTGQVATS